MNGNYEITLFGKTNFRNAQKKFGIKIDDRRRHMYVIGKTGMGKTTLLENMIIADIRAGKGVGIVDPHGELAEKILEFVPEERINDVIYFNPSDMEFPIAFNPLEQVGTEFRHLVASGIMGVFKKIWPDVWSARMEYILNNTLLALLEYPGSTLLGIMRMLSDKEYRGKVVNNLKDPVVKGFWVNEFAKYTQRLESEATASIQNKVGQFVTNPLVRNILGQSTSSIDMRKIMDERKILIVNLSKGRIGEDNSALLGAMVITKIQLSAMSRVDIPEKDRQDFYLYVDEFQNFATDSFATILSEARKYRLCLILAHQYIGQLTHGDNNRVRDAIFGNVGTMLSFRVGAEDGEFLEKEFEPDFMVTDFVNLPKYNFYLKLMIDGISSRPFSAQNIEPYKIPDEVFRNLIIQNSQRVYGTPKQDVEVKIAGEWITETSQASAGGDSRPGGDFRQPRRPEQSLSKALRPMSDIRQDRDGFRRPRPEEGAAFGHGQYGSQSRPQYRQDDRPRQDYRPFGSAPAEGEARYGRQDKPRQDDRSNRSDFTQQRPDRPFGSAQDKPRPNQPMSLSSLRPQESPAPVRPPEKRKVDMDDLRRSLEDALAKSAQDEKESAPPEE